MPINAALMVCCILISSSLLQSAFEIGHRADETLDNFCEWQASLKDEIYHDHAILMTGVDICVNRDAPCDTIGQL